MNNTPFSQHLVYLNKGTLNDELTEVLADVVKAVRDSGKQGSVTLQLKVSMLNKRDEDTVKLTPVVKHQIPELDRAETIMWSTADGDLLRNDPDQQDTSLRTVGESSKPNVQLDDSEKPLQKVS